jgi:hypothetical protein
MLQTISLRITYLLSRLFDDIEPQLISPDNPALLVHHVCFPQAFLVDLPHLEHCLHNSFRLLNISVSKHFC